MSRVAPHESRPQGSVVVGVSADQPLNRVAASQLALLPVPGVTEGSWSGSVRTMAAAKVPVWCPLLAWLWPAQRQRYLWPRR